jgi:cellulose synthase/poly-beta-1,6-N-acetylglucosamine synthase-like glycosyltransferase
MPHAFDFLLLAVYYGALVVLVLFGMHRGWLTYVFRTRGVEPAVPVEALLAGREGWPQVTVQLPMYNERLVAERVIRAAGRLSYPVDRLQIQVLDDSTDETRDVVDATVAELARRGLNIEVVRRADRVGYKAGALEHGLQRASGEFIAVFDADFVPPETFLHDLLGHFADPEVGAVQARWEHLNRNGMLLTRAQATLLDGHFVVEQTARSRLGRFFNFNGTAGLWRKAAIEDAGGWEHDTITEDLDLSYRAQLAGWRFVYRTDVTAPAELPADLGGFKSQQHRWAKGSIECWRKLLRRVAQSDAPLGTKLEALVHLSANLSYVAMVIVALTMPLTLAVRERFPAALGWALDLPLFVLGTGSVVAFYVTSQRFLGRRLWPVLAELPFVLAVDIGVSIHKARAVLEAMVGHQTAFVRTPKLALVRRSPRRIADAYLRKTWTAGVAEWCLTAWLVYGLIAAYGGPWPSALPVPFVALFAVGYAYVGGVAVVQALPSPQRAQRVLSAEA